MKPLTPAEVGQIAEDLIVTFVAHAAPPEVLNADPAMGLKVLTMLHSKVALAMCQVSGPEFAADNLAAMYNEMVKRMAPGEPVTVHAQPARPQ